MREKWWRGLADALQPGADAALCSRVEDAGLNASAPPQQRWMDGWLVRFSPGKAKRARCVNALAAGRQPLDRQIERVAAVYREAGLPMFVRITPFTQPPMLEPALAERGFVSEDDTRVMVCRRLPAEAPALPAGVLLVPAGAEDFAATVGTLRGSPPSQQQAQAQRIALSPVPYQGFVLQRAEDGAVLACGQVAQEGDLVGLYDVFTRPQERGHGWARLLCQYLLSLAARQGAGVGYLQVEADNAPARHIYHALGFADAYAYHYRRAPEPG